MRCLVVKKVGLIAPEEWQPRLTSKCACIYVHPHAHTQTRTYTQQEKKKEDNQFEMKGLLTGATMAVCLRCVRAHGGQQERRVRRTSDTPLGLPVTNSTQSYVTALMANQSVDTQNPGLQALSSYIHMHSDRCKG